MLILGKTEPIVVQESEQPVLDKIENVLEDALNSKNKHPAKLIVSQGEEIEIPDSVSRILLELVHYLGQGQTVSVIPIEKEMTTQEAANILNISRPYLVKLLESGELPFRKVGTHRRIRFDDIILYKKNRDKKRHELLAELTQMSQDLGFYSE